MQVNDDDLEEVEPANQDERRDGASLEARSLDPDLILDALVPKSIDWRGTVGRHPMVSVVTVGLVGYLVGRTKGSAILTGLTTGLSAALMRQLSDVFEGDFFDFD